MSKKCELTSKGVCFGNMVSHSQRKTRRKYKPNLQNITFLSNILGFNVRFKVSTSGLSTVSKHGGIDDYLLKTSDNILSDKAKKIRKILIKKTQDILSLKS